MDINTSLHWKKRFNDAALNFENDADIGLWGNSGFQQGFNTFFQILQENHSLDKGKIIVDIGCGAGAYARKLDKMGYTVVGIDYSENVIKKAIEKSQGENISYIIGALPYLPFKEKKFDIAICMGVFQSGIEDHSAAICDISKVLKENSGILILFTLNSFSIRIFYRKLLDLFLNENKRRTEATISVKRFNPNELIHLLRNENFHKFTVIKLYSLPKSLFSINRFFENHGIYRILTKIPIVSLLIANAFIIEAVRK